MARVVILLLTVVVVLNGLTFLVVVHLSPEPAARASQPAANTPSPSNPKLDAVARSVSGISTDVKSLGRRMRDVDSKLQRLEVQVKQLAVRQSVVSTAAEGPPAHTGNRQFPLSETTTAEEFGGAEADEPVETLEPEEVPAEPDPVEGVEEDAGEPYGEEEGTEN